MLNWAIFGLSTFFRGRAPGTLGAPKCNLVWYAGGTKAFLHKKKCAMPTRNTKKCAKCIEKIWHIGRKTLYTPARSAEGFEKNVLSDGQDRWKMCSQGPKPHFIQCILPKFLKKMCKKCAKMCKNVLRGEISKNVQKMCKNVEKCAAHFPPHGISKSALWRMPACDKQRIACRIIFPL